ncbi:glycosyltransferase family 4 protein [Mucilaginibacter sp. KACC 22063]|uniref:glycosyltransferase family 4 protein n=1 Tax=Mucilaginibacter sp. KACC 22063 TaxID=3025666 RepID=UPI0023672F6B|nr:glycosyltransferase family 4 protein [Mucilaginibacter sp. KACC 22063]WDF57137.1 glycosyltransferase family 4 protein [Mucilaginibacter sp. KACC 22063]
MARSTDNRFHTYTEGNITLHLIPKIMDRSAIFFFSSLYMFLLIRKLKVTHLLAQSSVLGGYTAAWASRIYKLPLMTEIHGEEYFRYLKRNSFKNKALAKIVDFSFRNSVVVRSLNGYMTKRLHDAGYHNIEEIPNRVDLSIFNRRKSEFSSSKPVKLVSVGRFVKEKNYLQLIENLHKSNLDFQLTLIGGGPLKSSYEDYINKFDLSARVRLIEWMPQSDLIDLIVNADIYIQYSVSEGMPRTIIEAMALNVPVISTNVGSISGVVKNERNGLLLPDFSVESLKTIVNKLSDVSIVEQLSNNAYHDVLSKYEWSNVFARYRSVILSMKLNR